MRIAYFFGAAALFGAALLNPAPAAAQQTIESAGLTIATTPAITTDYVFRGISQTRSRPAIQLTVDVEHESGLYIGVFASNANFAGTNIRQEVDLNFGYRFTVAGVKLDLGATYFGYPGYDKPPGGFEAAWWEGTLRATYEAEPFKFLGSVAYSPNFNFESGQAVYVEAGFDLTLDFGFTLGFRAGYQWIERNFANPARPNRGSFGAEDYGLLSLTVSREIGLGVIGAVQVTHVTLDGNDCFGGLKLCGTRYLATLSRPF
ncbi:TorF family putative porin [Leptolyngbya sp. 15MV]|nr:TorF family putative porin [Leptolyngbya sp. 15MV]